MIVRGSVVCAVAWLSATRAVLAQGPDLPVRSLTTPEVELPYQFSRMSGIRELSDARLVVVDPGEKLVAFVDFARASVTTIGREGSGPGEYSSAGRVLPGPGDTTIIGDLVGRFIKFAPNGTWVGDVSMLSPARGGAGGRVGNFTRIAADALGRLYKQASAFGTRRGRGPTGSDSVAIQRLDLHSGKLDTATTTRRSLTWGSR